VAPVPTVSYAAKEFLDSQESKGVAKSTFRAFSVLLHQRFVPFADEKGISLLSAFDLGDHPKPATCDHLKTGQR
jgi:hypothetical protein